MTLLVRGLSEIAGKLFLKNKGHLVPVTLAMTITVNFNMPAHILCTL